MPIKIYPWWHTVECGVLDPEVPTRIFPLPRLSWLPYDMAQEFIKWMAENDRNFALISNIRGWEQDFFWIQDFDDFLASSRYRDFKDKKEKGNE